MIKITKHQKYSENYDEITEFWKQGKGRKFLMDKYQISSSTLHGILQRLNLPNKEPKSVKLSKYELSVLIGTILGDSHILRGSSKTSSLNFAHSQDKKEYFYNKVKILESLKFVYIKEKENLDKRTNKYYKICTCTSSSFKELKDLRNIFYKDGKKVLPIEYLEDNFDKTSLAYLYMDDGSTQKYNTIISTQSFNTEDLQKFIILLKNKFDLNFTIQFNNTIRLKQKDVKKFKDLIREDVEKIECMKYKIMSS